MTAAFVAAALALAAAWTLVAHWQRPGLAVRAQSFGTLLRPPRPDWTARGDRIAVALAARTSPATRDAAEARARAAGWPAASGVRLAAATLLLPLLLPLCGVIAMGIPTDIRTLAILAGLAIAGRVGPGIAATNMATRRQTRIAAGLADAIDLLVICAESGLSLDVALARTGRELMAAQPALAGELAATAIELGFLPRRADAFANLARRVHLPQVQALADMFVQTERFGTPLAQALRTLAAEYRNSRVLRAEEKAARLPALMTVPMIAFILPPLFIVLIGPAILTAMAG